MPLDVHPTEAIDKLTHLCYTGRSVVEALVSALDNITPTFWEELLSDELVHRVKDYLHSVGSEHYALEGWGDEPPEPTINLG